MQPAVAQNQNAVRHGRGGFRVRDHDRGRAGRLALRAEQAEHVVRGIGIEVAGGFVGENQFRAMHKRARNRDALQFAAGELPWEIVAATAQTDRREHIERAGRRQIVEQQRQGDILRERQMRQHVKRLKHEPEFLPTQARGGIVVELRRRRCRR